MSVGLSYCDMLTPPPAPSGVNLALADATFTVTWDAVSGADKYEPQYQTVTGDEWTALPETEEISTTHTPAGGLTCGTTYGFRVRSYGDGIMHSADWGTPSNEVTHTTEACNAAPDFVVGTVSAPDTDEGDMVSYSITTGNEDGKFDIGDSSGEITVEDSLDHEIDAADKRLREGGPVQLPLGMLLQRHVAPGAQTGATGHRRLSMQRHGRHGSGADAGVSLPAAHAAAQFPDRLG